jgi:hypothetical protein
MAKHATQFSRRRTQFDRLTTTQTTRGSAICLVQRNTDGDAELCGSQTSSGVRRDSNSTTHEGCERTSNWLVNLANPQRVSAAMGALLLLSCAVPLEPEREASPTAISGPLHGVPERGLAPPHRGNTESSERPNSHTPEVSCGLPPELEIATTLELSESGADAKTSTLSLSVTNHSVATQDLSVALQFLDIHGNSVAPPELALSFASPEPTTVAAYALDLPTLPEGYIVAHVTVLAVDAETSVEATETSEAYLRISNGTPEALAYSDWYFKSGFSAAAILSD